MLFIWILSQFSIKLSISEEIFFSVPNFIWLVFFILFHYICKLSTISIMSLFCSENFVGSPAPVTSHVTTITWFSGSPVPVPSSNDATWFSSIIHRSLQCSQGCFPRSCKHTMLVSLTISVFFSSWPPTCVFMCVCNTFSPHPFLQSLKPEDPSFSLKPFFTPSRIVDCHLKKKNPCTHQHTESQPMIQAFIYFL